MADERMAVYRCYGASDEPLYIGATTQPEVRMRAHERLRPEWHRVKRIDFAWHETRAEALAAESAAIFAERPEWNLRDTPDWRPSPGPRSSETWLSTGDAAVVLRCSKSHVIKLVNRGILPAAKVGNRRRILRTVAEEWRDRMAREAGGEA